MKPSGIITLTTDFGLVDSYVGAMKGAVLSINPGAVCVDISHDIAAQDISGGMFVLSGAAPYYPPGTVHVAVVDPGVGSSRRPIVVETNDSFYVGPDNGIFSFILRGSDFRVYEITNPDYMRKDISTTFHGRDVFAPAAAHLSLGVLPEEMGPRVHDPVVDGIKAPQVLEGGRIVGSVIHIDGFGNIVTNLTKQLLESSFGKGAYSINCRGRHIRKVLLSYAQADEGELLAIYGSRGFLEISIRNGDAKKLTGCQVGDSVQIEG